MTTQLKNNLKAGIQLKVKELEEKQMKQLDINEILIKAKSDNSYLQ